MKIFKKIWKIAPKVYQTFIDKFLDPRTYNPCPRCGSSNVVFETEVVKQSSETVVLIIITFKCLECGKVYTKAQNFRN